MRNWLIIGMLAVFTVGVQAEEPKQVKEPKLAKVVNLEKSAKAIREGKLNVGKTYAMPEKNRFHNIHDVALSMPCKGCHNVDGGYPDNYLYVRKAKFPLQVDGEDVGAVHRAKCLACHSEGGLARPFYNITTK